MNCFELGQRVLPSVLKRKIARSQLAGTIVAKSLARTSKRLDLCSAQVAHVLHLSNVKVRGKTCMELGSGQVLSHACVLHLLGATKVIATDIARNWCPSALYDSVHVSEPSIIRDILSPFEEHHMLRSRLDKLLSIKSYSVSVLNMLGIEYVSPIDLARQPLGRKIDFVFSNSVLEHVPVADVLALFRNMTSDLSEGGAMIHCVHLEDHRNTTNAPFSFLSISGDRYTRVTQAERGNRIRGSQWVRLLAQIQDIDVSLIYEWNRRDKELPKVVDVSVPHLDNEDLRVSHIGILCRKRDSATSGARS